MLRYPRSFWAFRKFGRNVWLAKGGVFGRPEEITFGNNVFINECFHISARNLIFGDNIMIGPYLIIESDNHKYNKVGKPMFNYRSEREIGDIKIENDVWIGSRVTILKGVKVSEGSVVGAGSLITKTTPPYCISLGIPAKPLKTRFSALELKEHLNQVKSSYKYEEIIAIWNAYGF